MGRDLECTQDGEYADKLNTCMVPLKKSTWKKRQWKYCHKWWGKRLIGRLFTAEAPREKTKKWHQDGADLLPSLLTSPNNENAFRCLEIAASAGNLVATGEAIRTVTAESRVQCFCICFSCHQPEYGRWEGLALVSAVAPRWWPGGCYQDSWRD